VGLRIKTNVESLVAQRQLSQSRQDMNSSLEKLSSGQRINKSSDDAAGLAVSESMKAKVRGLSQAKRNANDGISYLQVAEGGLSELSNVVVRMRELTTQAASDTIGERERSYLNEEFKQLREEISRIKDGTEFNGKRVLSNDGGKDIGIQVGASYRGTVGNEGSTNDGKGDTIYINFDKLETLNQSLSELGDLAIEGTNGQELGGGDTGEVFQKLDDAMTNVAGFRANLGALQSRLNSTVTNIDVSVENMNAAQSRIRDVDYAAETAKLAQSRILTAAGTSVLSQANSSSDSVLQLLRG
jgi:flagellin